MMKTFKMAVQELIDYGAEFIHYEDLNPEYYPLRLRHNDYDGLDYEMEDENKYVGYFQ